MEFFTPVGGFVLEKEYHSEIGSFIELNSSWGRAIPQVSEEKVFNMEVHPEVLLKDLHGGPLPAYPDRGKIVWGCCDDEYVKMMWNENRICVKYAVWVNTEHKSTKYVEGTVSTDDTTDLDVHRIVDIARGVIQQTHSVYDVLLAARCRHEDRTILEITMPRQNLEEMREAIARILEL